MSAGEVGIGLTFATEVVARVAQGRHTVRLQPGRLEHCGGLVFRNVSAQGASRTNVFGIRAFRVSVSRLPPPPVVLDGPRGISDGPMANWSRFYGRIFEDIDVQLGMRQLDEMGEPRAMRWLWGLSVMVDPSTEMGRAVYLSGRYEPTTMYVMGRLLDSGGCVFDVGANAGLFTLAATRRVGEDGRVVAFEPSPREYALLRKNVDLNRLTNVRTVQRAVGDKIGVAGSA